MSYTRITSPGPTEQGLASLELASLAKIWRERKQQIVEHESYVHFLTKLKREWAIETGFIERLYEWDRGVTEILIQQGIEAAIIAHKAGFSEVRAEDIVDVIRDQEATIDGIFDFVTGERGLTEHYIRSLHDQLTLHQETTTALTQTGQRVELPLRRGAYKQRPNNPRRDDDSVHEYCPPEFVNDEMERLVQWYQESNDDTAPEVLAAWLHHRFTQIHPFQDGNGRVARALASLVFLKAGLFPLVIRDADRTVYLNALEAADRGDLTNLVDLFVIRQRDAILQAISLEREARRDRQLDQILDSAISLLQRRQQAYDQELERVFQLAELLEDEAHASFSKLADTISARIRELSVDGSPYTTRAELCREGRNSRYYFQQIVDVAHIFRYFANTNTHRSWVRLLIQTADPFFLLVSFHGFGHQFEGILAASAFTFRHVADDDDSREVVDLRPVTPELFQFNYAESDESTLERFRAWLRDAMTLGMAEWQRSLSG